MNKKAFTLIELLAVIVILAIIALIATPIILGVVDDAKRSAAKSSAYGYVEAIEKTIFLKNMADSSFIFPNSFPSATFSENDVKHSGSKPSKVDFTLVDGMVDSGTIKFDKYEFTFKDGKIVGDSATEPEKVLYKEAILNGTDPVLDEGMIPVIINNDGSVTKADTYKEWYNYSNKTWANAVLVTSDYRDTIKKADVNTKLDTTKILTYLVWIPRYKYELFNTGTGTVAPQEIKIIFEDKTVTKSNGTKNGENYSHPAFTFGDKELNGIWVGKFETTGNDTTPTVLPNVLSLRYQSVSKHFTTVKKFTSSTYGLTSEAKMMKNSEWGAVAYLSHSKYGINKSVRANNNSNLITGCGANVENGAAVANCEIIYGKSTSYPQSTTGNISGIFDMVGGSYEFMMGYLTTANSNYASNPNGYFGWTSTNNYAEFTSKPDDKYFDNYRTTDKNTACNGGTCKGDAVTETSSWYATSIFPIVTSPWFIRGGNSGLFYHSSSMGAADNVKTCRLTVVN